MCPAEKELRKRWDSLRTQYARYKKLAPLQKTGRQQWILTQLQFLDPHTKSKESTSSLNVLVSELLCLEPAGLLSTFLNFFFFLLNLNASRKMTRLFSIPICIKRVIFSIWMKLQPSNFEMSTLFKINFIKTDRLNADFGFFLHILRTTPRRLNQIRPQRSTTARPGPASLMRTPLNRSSVPSAPSRNRPPASPRRRTSEPRPRWVPPNSRALWSGGRSAAGRCWTSPRTSRQSWCATSGKP